MRCEDIYEYVFGDCVNQIRDYKIRFSDMLPGYSLSQEASGSIFGFEEQLHAVDGYVMLVNHAVDIVRAEMGRMLLMMLDRYGLQYELGPREEYEDGDLPLFEYEWDREIPFIMDINRVRTGFRIASGANQEAKDVEDLMSATKLSQVITISLAQQSTKATSAWMKWHPGLINIADFFTAFFDNDEFETFSTYVGEFNDEVATVFSYRAIRLPSEDALNDFRKSRASLLLSRVDGYCESLSEEGVYPNQIERLRHNYVDRKLYLAMVGQSTFADSFISSEWFYSINEGTGAIDLTGIISGYLKSVEQLLLAVVQLSNNTGRKISRRGSHQKVSFATANADIIDTTLGSLRYYLKDYPELFDVSSFVRRKILDTVAEWTKYYRNGYFHKDNLHSKARAIATRDQAIYLYFLILGGCNIADEDLAALGVPLSGPTHTVTKEELRRATLERESDEFDYQFGEDISLEQFKQWFLGAFRTRPPWDEYVYPQTKAILLCLYPIDGEGLWALRIWLLSSQIGPDVQYADATALVCKEELVYESKTSDEEQFKRIAEFVRLTMADNDPSSLVDGVDHIDVTLDASYDSVAVGVDPTIDYIAIR